MDLRFPGAVRSDFRSFGPFESSLLQVLFDLLSPWAAGGKVLGRVALDFELAIRSTIEFITQLPQPCSEFRAINRSGIALRSVKLAGLQSVGLPVRGFGNVENHGMGMQLRCGIAVHRAGAVMLEFGGDHFAGGFSRVVASDTGLDIVLQFVQGNAHALPMSLPDSLIASDQGSDRNTLGRAEGSIPTGSVAGSGDGLALTVLVLTWGSMPHQLFTGLGMLSLGQAIELTRLDLALQTPGFGEFALPLTAHSARLGVVVLVGVRKLLLVIGVSLSAAQRLGDR